MRVRHTHKNVTILKMNQYLNMNSLLVEIFQDTWMFDHTDFLTVYLKSQIDCGI